MSVRLEVSSGGVARVPDLMDTLLDLRDLVDLPPDPAGDRDGDGFVDCRGVIHQWDEER